MWKGHCRWPLLRHSIRLICDTWRECGLDWWSGKQDFYDRLILYLLIFASSAWFLASGNFLFKRQDSEKEDLPPHMTRVSVPEIRKVWAYCSFLKLSAFNDHLKNFSMFSNVQPIYCFCYSSNHVFICSWYACDISSGSCAFLCDCASSLICSPFSCDYISSLCFSS